MTKVKENMSSETSSELFRKWALVYAESQGMVIKDENVTVELTATTEGSGCCEQCYTEEAVMVLKVGNREFYLDRWGFTG